MQEITLVSLATSMGSIFQEIIASLAIPLAKAVQVQKLLTACPAFLKMHSLPKIVVLPAAPAQRLSTQPLMWPQFQAKYKMQLRVSFRL